MREQKVGEVVDGRDGEQRLLAVGRPRQVRPEHHRQIVGRHLVQATAVLYLWNTYNNCFIKTIINKIQNLFY